MTAALNVDAVMAMQPVIPVITIDNVDDAVTLAQTLVDAGLPVVEVTLRTPAALESIRRMAGVNGAVIGAGTILSAKDVDAATAAGARFIVTPGLTEATVAAARRVDVPILPGVATASEIMMGLDMGLDRFKFFPAEQAGGLPMLAAFEGPFAQVKFCPTGSITFDLAPQYLKRPNVAVVGGGWIAPRSLIHERAWEEIRFNAVRAAALKRG
jgi:2-dehydro-3-deoxyphosphogluconate aldolase/(4S)-4-hydroxy-2-oxoglutarate aldolase